MRTAVLENPGDIAWHQTNLKLLAATAKPMVRTCWALTTT